MVLIKERARRSAFNLRLLLLTVLIPAEVPMVLLVSMHMFHAASSSCWHLNNTENRSDAFNRISLLPPQSSFFRQKLPVINPLLLQGCITLMLHPWLCRCSCPGLCVCAASVSMAGFSQSFIFHPFLPSRNTSLHQDSSAPCFWVLWLTCSSLLPSMMSFMPRGPLLSLPLSCFHF